MPVLVAYVQMAAELGGSAGFNGTHRPKLVETQAMRASIFVTVGAEYLRDLVAWPTERRTAIRLHGATG